MSVLVLLFVVVACVAGWLLVVWLMAKHPILGVPIAVYVGLAMWLGANDAQALTCYVLIALAFVAAGAQALLPTPRRSAGVELVAAVAGV